MALTLVLSAAAASALPGCTADEVAATALVIGAVAIVSDGDATLEVREHRYDRLERRGWDRYESPRHHGPGRRGHRFADETALLPFKAIVASAPQFVSSDSRVVNLAHNYNVSHYAATYLVRAIVLAEAKDVSGVRDLGLELKDFRKLYEGKSIAPQKVATLGAKLRLSEAETAQLISDMSEDVQIEKAVRGL